MQPVNDLQRLQRFDDFDLEANRNGQWSQRQRRRFLLVKLAEHLMGALVVELVIAVFVHLFGLAPGLDLIALNAAIIIVVTVVLWAIHVRSALGMKISSVSGTVSKDEYVPPIGYPLALVKVGPQRFYIAPELYRLLEDEATYKVYYLDRNPRIGGALLFSLEAGYNPPPDQSQTGLAA